MWHVLSPSACSPSRRSKSHRRRRHVEAAQGGACSVHNNRELQRACDILVKDVKPGDKIVTIEGLSRNGDHPVQKAWLALDVPQCGYCQAGQIMAATALLKKKPKPTDADIDAAMTNICRCGTYSRIRAAIHQAAGNTSAASINGNKA